MEHRARHVAGRAADDDRHFDMWSRTYDRSPTQVLFFAPIQRAVSAALARRRSGGRVLDIGAGTGRLLDRLGRELPEVALFGLDRSAGMVGAAHRARPQLQLVRATAEGLPFPDESFDMVTTTLSFHHWSDQISAVAEVRRVLRPGGVFALADFSLDDFPRWVPVRGAARRRLAHGLPLAERHRLLEGAGLRVVEEGRALYGHWIPLTLAERVESIAG
jgi:ubiquinone/menaquinone biosynthesis C-methylase UbiE